MLTATDRPSTVAARLGGGLIAARTADVGRERERNRRRRLRVLALVLGAPCAYLWYGILTGDPVNLLQLPSLPPDWPIYLVPIALIAALGVAVAMPLLSGRSPHMLVHPDQIDVGFDDVVGIDGLRDDVTRTLNTFLGHELYRERLGGTPRRGLLFEGPPGTGKTHLAKAMAKEAGVPFLFVSATSFQSMWYGATARKLRSFFTDLRAIARKEGGAIAFIEEIDAIGGARHGVATSSSPYVAAAPGGLVAHPFGSVDGAGGVVNELLIQLQSFDAPPRGVRVRAWFVEHVNRYLPAHRQVRAPRAAYANVLVIAATNRAGDLDPALLRPGRFDRRIVFDAPAKPARRALIDHFLNRKAHDAELDRDDRRDQLAGQTFGYTPVMIEHLFDEALVSALKGGRDGMSWEDVQAARLDTEVGTPNPVPYTDAERRRVATHEAGHATVAYLSQTRRLEVLSIIKRKGSLGLLAHGDLEEVYTRTRHELFAMVDIAMGGLCAEARWFGDVSTGPSSDLAAATQTACQVIGAAGMGTSLVSLAAVQRSSFNDENLVGRTLADPVMRPQVEELLTASRERVAVLLDRNAHLVEALRDALLARDELIGDEIVAVLESAGPAVLDDLRVETPA